MTIKMIITQLKAAALNTFVKKSVISLKANIGKCGDFGREEWYARRGSNPQPLASEAEVASSVSFLCRNFIQLN